MTAELDGDQLLASMQAAAEGELFDLAARLFVQDYRSSNTNHQERAAHAILAAEAFLDLRDAEMRAAMQRASARARRAANRQVKETTK